MTDRMTDAFITSARELVIQARMNGREDCRVAAMRMLQARGQYQAALAIGRMKVDEWLTPAELQEQRAR